VSLSVHNGNSAPSVTDLTFTVAHDSGLGDSILSGATDADDDPLRAILISGPSHGTLALGQDGSFNYTPSLGYSGADSFTYQALEGPTSSATRTVTLTVGDGAPDAADARYSVLSSGTTTVGVEQGVLANDSDVEGNDLTTTLVSGPASG